MPLKSALLRDFGGCCFAVTLLKVAFMVIRGDLKIVITETCDEHIDAIRWLCSELDTAEILENKEKQQ